MILLDIFRNADLPSFTVLFNEINADMGNSQIWLILILACLMLTMHGVIVLMIAGTFHWIDQILEDKRIYGANFLSNFIAKYCSLSPHT